MEFALNRRLIAALAAVVVAALSWWLLREVEEAAPAAAGSAEQGTVDYYVNNFALTAMDEAGLPAHRLVATSLRHFAERDVAEIARPRMTVYRAEGTPWLVTADAGLLTMPERVLQLQGAVTIARDAGPANESLQVDTRDVTVRLNDDYAETAAPVTVHHQQGLTEAIGMTADLRQGRYELLQQVRGTYVVKKN